MAIDQLLLHHAAVDGKTTLRFYEWSEPTLSVGYFQSAHDRSRHNESLDCPLIRRSSGGGAIVHDLELTYSFATPNTIRSSHASRHLYNAFHETLVRSLSDFGIQATLCEPAGNLSHDEPFLCFQRRALGDVLCGEHKVVGSAQRRFRSAIMQHGSILLHQSACAPQLPGLQQTGGQAVAADAIIKNWLPRIQERLGLETRITELAREEVNQAGHWVSRQFGNPHWTHRR